MVQLYQPGDIVKVKNATNGLGVYQIIDYNDKFGHGSGSFYRVHVLDIDRETLPFDKSGQWKVRPSQYMKMAAKNPELYKIARFRRYNLTTKMTWNVSHKLPFTADQVVA